MPQVAADDHFFLLGGNSISATQVVARLRESLGLELNLRLLFEAPVLADFAAHPQHIVRAAFAGREGNPAIFPRALYGELAALREGEAGVTVIRRHEGSVRTVEAAFAQELADVDTPDTLLALEAFKLQR